MVVTLNIQIGATIEKRGNQLKVPFRGDYMASNRRKMSPRPLRTKQQVLDTETATKASRNDDPHAFFDGDDGGVTKSAPIQARIDRFANFFHRSAR